MLADRGLATTVDDVAEAAGVSRRTVFRHFSTRENLFAVAIRDGLRTYGEHLPPAPKADLDSWLLDVLQAAHRLNAGNGRIYWELSVLEPELTGELAAAAAERREARKQWAAGVTRVMWRARGGRGTPPSWLADAVAVHLSGFTTQSLAVDFDRTPAALSTAFALQNDLKLVAHCRDRDSYEQNLIEEYLAYRLYNLLTETSFRVRLARITYRDTHDRRPALTRLAFLVENPEMLAERLGGIHLEAPGAAPGDLHALASARAELFQYMIGNTDFSIVNFHNAEVFRLPDGQYHPVPYDFDFSGLVDAPYAAPAALLGTRSVRDRVFRGFCRPTVDMTGLYSEFLALRDAFAATLRSRPELAPDNAEHAIRYLEEFFKVIESPRARRNLIERRCRIGID